MKWGRKKKPLTSPSPCSRPSSISQIFSVSWLSKFKPDCGNFSTRLGKVRPEGNRNSQLMGSLQRAVHDEGRFHAREDDPFWRISFGEDRAEGDKGGEGASKAISSDSNVTNLVAREKTASRFRKNPTSGVRAMKLLAQYMPEVEAELEIPRKDHNLRILKSSRAAEKRELELQRPPKWSSEGEIPEFEGVNQRKSLHSRKRTKAFSPKLETCKIKALEDKKKKKKKKKTRTKMKKKSEERTVGERVKELENFAVVKWSYDPGQDFRDSMAEMIEEKKINRPEELEELLACYLTLNCDDYHDLIIKVFRQLWYDVNQEKGIAPGLQGECCSCCCHD